MALSGSYMGMHQQDPVEQWNLAHNHAYLAGNQFRLLKDFHPETYAQLQAASPGTAFVFRHHIEDSHQGAFIDQAILGTAQADAAADGYILQFRDSVNQHMGTNDNGLKYCESVNEEYPTHNPEKLAKIVAFDRAFVRRLRVHCPGTRPIVFTAAVGNPDHDEYGALVDLARETEAAGGAFGYHGYWTVYNGQSFVNNPGVARDLHMRWEVIDEYLVARGIRVDWMIGECGATKGNSSGYQPDVIEGWKSGSVWGGNEDAYLADIAAFDELLAGTRAAREGRLIGATLFTSRPGDGGTWHYFNITGNMMWKIANHVAAKVAPPPPVIEPPPPPDNIPLPSRIIDYVDELPMNTESDDWPYETRPLDAINNIIVHHSVGQPTNPPESIAIGHINRNGGGADGWPGIGYHFYINVDASGNARIYKTNHLTTWSYHAGVANRESIGVCIAGDFTTVHPSPEQLEAARFLIAWLQDTLGQKALMKHRDVAATQCPGNTWEQWWAQLTTEPEPEPRRYHRTCHLLPQDATPEEMALVMALAYPQRQTVLFSADDAFSKPPEITGRTVIVWDVERVAGSEQALRDWVTLYYPPWPLRTEFRRLSSLFAPRYASPVGTAEQRASGEIWPGEWVSAATYGMYYRYGSNLQYEAYHTGDDLNLNSPAWNSDRGMTVHAMGAGVVSYARLVSNSTWGLLVVIDHGDGLCSRYAHMATMLVSEGDTVQCGDVIGTIGGTQYGVADHLHFDISLNGRLLTNPTDWPGMDRARVLRDYVNPRDWLRANV